jgi:hypothetical protein
LDLEDHLFHQVERTIFLNLDYQTMLKLINNHDLSVMSEHIESLLSKFVLQRIKKY